MDIDDDMTLAEVRVAGLKQAIGKQSNLKKCAVAQLNKMNELFAQSIGAMFELDVATDKITELIWEYVNINKLWWKGQSEHVGVFSTIADYTNKRGQTSKAHYTQNGKYLKPAKEGDVPISYEGHFRVTREKFDFDIYIGHRVDNGVWGNTNWVLDFCPK